MDKKSVDLSIINMTSGWHEKVISLTHKSCNVRVNDKTGKRAFGPDDISEHRASVHFKQVFRDTLMQICIYMHV